MNVQDILRGIFSLDTVHFSHQDFLGKESDQAKTQSAAFYVGGFVFVFHDKYQSYKHEKIGGWVGELNQQSSCQALPLLRLQSHPWIQESGAKTIE